MLDAVREVADHYWSINLKGLCRYAADAVKFDRRTLTPEDIKDLEAAKHYIELALQNDQFWKGENAV